MPGARGFCATLLLTLSPTLILAANVDNPERWATYPASLDEVLRRYPSEEANRTALDVERLSADIGIEVAPRELPERQHLKTGGKPWSQTTKESIANYVNEQLKRPDAGVEPPTKAVADFLSERQGALEALRERLAHGDPPRWERHLEKLNANIGPDLLGLMYLQKVLISDAIAKAARRDERGALLDLDASWTLNTASRDEPGIYSQLIAIAAMRMQVGTLRHLEDVPAFWSDRLYEHDYRESLLAALQMQGWTWTQFQVLPWMDETKGGLTTAQRVVRTTQRIALGPYWRVCMKNTAELWKPHLVRLSESHAPCDADSSALDAELRESIPWWNDSGQYLISVFSGLMPRVSRLEIDIELTSRALELKAARRRTGSWPPTAAQPDESLACPGTHWAYESSPGNERSIALDRDLNEKHPIGLILPLRFVTSGTHDQGL